MAPVSTSDVIFVLSFPSANPEWMAHPVLLKPKRPTFPGFLLLPIHGTFLVLDTTLPSTKKLLLYCVCSIFLRPGKRHMRLGAAVSFSSKQRVFFIGDGNDHVCSFYKFLLLFLMVGLHVIGRNLTCFLRKYQSRLVKWEEIRWRL